MRYTHTQTTLSVQSLCNTHTSRRYHSSAYAHVNVGLCSGLAEYHSSTNTTVGRHLSKLVGTGSCSDNWKVRMTKTLSNIQTTPAKVLLCSLWTLVSVNRSEKLMSFRLIAPLARLEHS